MIHIENEGVKLLQFENLIKQNEVTHFVSTRNGGKSSGPYASMNIGFGTDDNAEIVLQNRQKLSQAVDIPLNHFVFANQTHSNHVAIVNQSHKGNGALNKHTALYNTDALITNQAEICLFIMTADCTPVLLFDPVNKAIAAIHAGWRGTVDAIVVNTIQQMRLNFNTQASDLTAAIGPCIGPCCYEVGEDVVEKVKQAFDETTELLIPSDNPGKYFFNLSGANKKQLLQSGVLPHHIESAELCTQCHTDLFFSSRFGKGTCGRFGTGIMIM
jgi:polyphenol oxidase